MSGEHGPLEHFACPVCGRVRPLQPSAATRIRSGKTSGECAPGVGCRAGIDDAERHRRFWLHLAGITDLEIRAAGGARGYVLEFGLPGELAGMAGAMPNVAPTRRASHIHDREGRPAGRYRPRTAA